MTITANRILLAVLILLLGQTTFGQVAKGTDTELSDPQIDNTMQDIKKTEAEWLEELGEARYRILRQCNTEPPFTGKYNKHFEEGRYACAGCGAILFSSDTKYDSGSGWPSFFAAAEEGAIKEERDTSYGMIRTEITCARCDGHLGHVFEDGPRPTGLRYCVNSASMQFVPATDAESQ